MKCQKCEVETKYLWPDWCTKCVQQERNRCTKCGKSDQLERRNYDMMWGEAELWCTGCEMKVRDMDYG